LHCGGKGCFKSPKKSIVIAGLTRNLLKIRVVFSENSRFRGNDGKKSGLQTRHNPAQRDCVGLGSHRLAALMGNVFQHTVRYRALPPPNPLKEALNINK